MTLGFARNRAKHPVFPAEISFKNMSEDLHVVPLQDTAASKELTPEEEAAAKKIRSIEEYNSKVVTYADDHEHFALGFTKYQFLVLLSAWLGWGFDVFDAYLFTYAAPMAVPALLAADPTTAETKALVGYWTAILTALLLLGWGVGGILFGIIADRWGRARTLMLSIGIYSIATAACALSINMTWLVVFRFVSAVGVGGEWASGAALLAESMPADKRVMAGALMFTSAPIGSFCGFLVNFIFEKLFPGTDETPDDFSWRLVFAVAIIPIFITMIIRFRIKEPEKWAKKAVKSDSHSIGELFSSDLKRRTLTSIFLVLLTLIIWWCISTMIPTYSSWLATEVYKHQYGANSTVTHAQPIKDLTMYYNGWGSASLYLGGIAGAIAVVFLATDLHWARLSIFKLFFATTIVSIIGVYYPDFQTSRDFNVFRLVMMFPLGLATQGFFAIFAFYIPEQFPTTLRGRGAGLTYNTSRILTAFFPLTIGEMMRSGMNPSYILMPLAIIPVIGLIFLYIPDLAFETQYINLYDEDLETAPSNREIDADDFGDHKFVVLGDDEEFNPQARTWWRGNPPGDFVDL